MARMTLTALLLYTLSSLIYLTLLLPVSAAPLSARVKNPVPAILGPQPPHFVVYSDESQFGIPQASDLQGYNVLILSFLLASGPADQAAAWTQLSQQQRTSLKAGYKAKGITLLVSAFGSTEAPTTDRKDPTAMAESMAAWVKQWGIDGIDVDYEDFKAVAKGTAVKWLETFTTVLRKNLPAGQFVITHAPVAPWFGPSQPYAQLDAAVGSLIDWYNVQFYSQGTAYTTCETLVTTSGGLFPGSAVLEVVAVLDANANAAVGGNVGARGNGKLNVGWAKVVVGKPGTPADVGVPQGDGSTHLAGGGTQVAGGGTQVAGGGTQVAAGGGTQVAAGGGRRARHMPRGVDPHINGFLEPQTLAQCLLQAKQNGWNAGVMAWEYPHADAKWIQTVRSLAWPFTS